MHSQSIASLLAQLHNRSLSSRELTQHYLARIQRLDPQYNAFVTLTAEQALKQADAADLQLAQGNAHPLCGLPIAHKDIFCTEGVRTSCGSKMLDNFIPPYNATIVENYLNAGVVMLGKTNMD
ncbi:MAG: Asp-tRNA(Asn)/Glu-tRNA(Gln) amidotransferase subunit GatA, partial [Pseudomonadota bacterium]